VVASSFMAKPTHAVEPLPLNEGKTTVVSVISSSAAVLAACSCCILPMVLAAAGLSAGLSSVLAPLGSLHWPMTALSMIAVAASWLIVLRKYRRKSHCDSQAAFKWFKNPQIIMLLVATVLSFIAAAWGYFEPTLMKAFM
jgi:mercuric ion transport protein